MKLVIVAASNIRFSPYINYYTDILDSMGLEYDLIFPDRKGVKDHFVKRTLEYKWKNNKSTLLNYFEYSLFVKKTIKREKYGFVIVLTTQNAVFLSIFLKRNYRNKYIVDIRDYSHEDKSIYFHYEKKALKNSALNIISSKKFLTFLPKKIPFLCLNNLSSIGVRKLFTKPSKSVERITIGYVGSISYEEQVKSMANLVKNDERFVFELFGKMPDNHLLEAYLDSLDCNRIKYHGSYKPEEKESIIHRIDILFNAYGNNSILLNTALSNKLFDSLFYGKPILNSPNTYMSEVCKPFSFDICFENRLDLNDLFNWYKQLDELFVCESQNSLLEQFKKENESTLSAIKRTIKDIL